MSRLSALLPVAQGVACQAALGRHADTLIGTGDARSRGQIMADTLVERVTGQAHATDVAIEINLIMTDETLLAEGDEPGRISGHGPVPAPIARALSTGGSTPPRWIRRLYTAPVTGRLVAMESRRRRFTAGQLRVLDVQDDTCRTPWCDAPIRHDDHIRRHADGGVTGVVNGVVNGRGLCAACNYARETPGWRAGAPDGAGFEIVLRTPTGHCYRGRPPDLPARDPALGPDASAVERGAFRWFNAA